MAMNPVKYFISCCIHSQSTTHFPVDLSESTLLETLTIEDNTCYGMPDYIPPDRLRTLEIKRNKFTKTVLPYTFNPLVSLTFLEVYCNDGFPFVFPTGLVNLVTLKLDASLITEVPPGICKLLSLRYLSLIMNGIKTLPLEMIHMRDLVHLDLSQNLIEEFPVCITFMTGLTGLFLRSNMISMIPTTDMSRLVSLRTLILSSNQLGDSFSNTTLHLPSLIELYLSNNHLTSLPKLSNAMTDLRTINLDHNLLSHVPSHFIGPTVKHITTLSVRGNPSLTTLSLELGNTNDLITNFDMTRFCKDIKFWEPLFISLLQCRKNAILMRMMTQRYLSVMNDFSSSTSIIVCNNPFFEIITRLTLSTINEICIDYECGKDMAIALLLAP